MPPISPASRESLTEKFHALLDECDTVADNALFGPNPRQHSPSMTSKHSSLSKDEHSSEKSSKKNSKNESNNPKPTKHPHAPIVKKKRQSPTAVDSLLKYLRNNSERLNYAERLLQGRAIGGEDSGVNHDAPPFPPDRKKESGRGMGSRIPPPCCAG